MYKKLRNKIVLYTMLSVFALLAVILTTINVFNFVAVAEEADHVTQRISDTELNNVNMENELGQMGPGSKEVMASQRFFIYNETNGTINLKMSSISEDEAIEWAKSLSNAASKGWTRTTYRYGIYEKNSNKYIIVVDQYRELNPSYRILIVSMVASALGMVIVFFVSLFVAKKIVEPIEKSDNKQKRFIADAALALKTPVSVISLDNETLISESEEKAPNKSIKHQINKLFDLANDLNALGIAASVKANVSDINLSNVMKDVIYKYERGFKDNKKELNLDIQEDVHFAADLGMMRKMFSELIENSLKYSDSKAYITLKKDEERIVIKFINDSKGIPNGSLDQIFERFYRLDYKDHSKYPGSGVGLSIVKEIVEKHNGRVMAKGQDNSFELKIEL